MTVTVKWHGAKAKAAVHSGAASGLRDAADDWFDATQRAVPVETGALKRSGNLNVDEATLHADITYGGGLSRDYAGIIHEKLEIHHDNGSAKYLENPTRAAAPRVGPTIAAAIRRKL
jgi:hypothetical protein